VLLFTTTDGLNFTFSAKSIVGGNSDYYGGIAFGSNNTCYAEGFPSTVLESVDYIAKTVVASYPWTAPAGSFGPLGVDLANGRVIGLATSTTAGLQTVNLFDLKAMTNGLNNPISTSYVATTNANPSGSGSVAITPTGAYAFVLDSQNGIMAFELSVKSAAVASGATTSSISAGPGSNYTIKYSGGQAINYVLLKSVAANAAMSTWTPVATNSGTLSTSNFVVTPSGARTFYRVSSRSN
jgi:hypothetical protein